VSDGNVSPEGGDQMKAFAELAAKHLAWPKATMTPSAGGFLVETAACQFTLPATDELKAQTIHTLLNRLKEPATVEAGLLETCTLSYRLVPDWDGPGEIVGIVITAPRPAYERLQDKRLYASIISVMSTMVCERIGSDCLECADG
jgi:hypothetical protein